MDVIDTSVPSVLHRDSDVVSSTNQPGQILANISESRGRISAMNLVGPEHHKTLIEINNFFFLMLD